MMICFHCFSGSENLSKKKKAKLKVSSTQHDQKHNTTIIQKPFLLFPFVLVVLFARLVEL